MLNEFMDSKSIGSDFLVFREPEQLGNEWKLHDSAFSFNLK